MSAKVVTMIRPVILAILALAALSAVSAKEFERCELANLMAKEGFKDLDKWFCLMMGNNATDGIIEIRDGGIPKYRYFGIFAIKEGANCELGKPGGLCNKDCIGK